MSAGRVLSKLDGAHSVQEIAEMLRIPFAYAAKVIYSLHKAGLVEPAAAAGQSGSRSCLIRSLESAEDYF
jgi:DNA-binding IscR family transcriptional regulator